MFYVWEVAAQIVLFFSVVLRVHQLVLTRGLSSYRGRYFATHVLRSRIIPKVSLFLCKQGVEGGPREGVFRRGSGRHWQFCRVYPSVIVLINKRCMSR